VESESRGYGRDLTATFMSSRPMGADLRFISSWKRKSQSVPSDILREMGFELNEHCQSRQSVRLGQ